MEGVVTEVLIDGLNGGHSGAEIDKNRANANKLWVFSCMNWDRRLLQHQRSVRRTKDNAITRSCKATLVLGEEDLAEAKITAEKLQKDLRTEYAGSDEGITISVTTGKEETVQALSMVSKEKVVFYLVHVPFGIEKMSGEIEGLVETSSNLGILKLGKDALYSTSSVRSSVGSAKEHLSAKLQYLTEFLGGSYEEQGDYPAWEYRKDSRMRDLMADVYEELFGEKPVVKAIHAGLECGLFYDKIPGLDCVSFGPTMIDIHTTEEKLSIPSTEKMWKYLVHTLEKMNTIR